MTTLATKTLCAFLIASSFSFASSAHANNSFNKYKAPVSVPSTHAFQSTTFSPVNLKTTRTIVTAKGVKRIVQPLPQSQKLDLSLATDNGSQNLEKGFNKMKKRSMSRARPMRTYVDMGAQSAR